MGIDTMIKSFLITVLGLVAGSAVILVIAAILALIGGISDMRIMLWAFLALVFVSFWWHVHEELRK
jgi:hypothetical protein